MTTPDAEFERELELFRTESEQAAQFFYAGQTIRAVAADEKGVGELLRQSSLFWLTVLAALQTAAFIALGRVFDQQSAHNLDKLLRLARDNPTIFSKAALRLRRQGSNPQPPIWLEECIRDAYQPTPTDFRRFRAHIRKWRKIYEGNYRDLRNKVFAHKELSHGADATLWEKTNDRELERLFAFLGSLHSALSQLFVNGRKPVLRPLRYSVKRMRDLPSSTSLLRPVQEKITLEVELFLKSVLATAQPRV
jgi:hypothetical protein